MADVTYAQLGALSLPVQDADLLAAYRGGGPLQRLTAEDLKDYLGSGTFLRLDGTSAMTGQFLAVAGSAGSPGISASGDANTGFYFPSADSIAVVTGGLERMRWYGTGVNILVPIVQLVPLTPPQGRLTLTTGVPVTTGDVTAATTVYYTPYNGGSIPINDVANSLWKDTPCVELSLPLSATYHLTNTNYDLYVVNDGGTLRLASGEAWSSATSRGTTAEVTRVEGIVVNNAIQTMRWGTSAGNTVSVSAQAGTYVGTIRTVAAGQAEDSAAKRFVFNAYNRVLRPMSVRDATDSWSVSSETWQQLNGSTANQLAFVTGLSENAVTAYVVGSMSADNGNRWGNVGVGIDSTTTNSALVGSTGTGAAGYFAAMSANYSGFPGVGYHYAAALQRIRVNDGTAYTFYGDNAGDQGFVTGIIGSVWA